MKHVNLNFNLGIKNYPKQKINFMQSSYKEFKTKLLIPELSRQFSRKTLNSDCLGEGKRLYAVAQSIKLDTLLGVRLQENSKELVGDGKTNFSIKHTFPQP